MPAGAYIVEVNGLDGLKHHVGPFRRREEAEAWIAQNPSAADTAMDESQTFETRNHRKLFADCRHDGSL
jgi:hypothetical protein